MARLFLAIDIPDEIREAIGRLSTELAAFDLRRVPVQKLHFTIRFLGEIPEARIADLQTACREGAGHAAPFQVAVQGLSAFPSTRRPRAIFVAGQARPALLGKLVGIVNGIADRFSVPLEKRPFRLHATIARVKKRVPTPLRDLLGRKAAAPFGDFLADRLTLFRSTLRSGPPRYDRIASFSLGGTA